MRKLIILLFVVAAVVLANPADSSMPDQCDAILHAESIRRLSQDELLLRRQEIMQQVSPSAVRAICESSTAITFDGYKQLLQQAEQEIQAAGGAEYGSAELYFFLVCGEDQVNLSPLAYHAFNLNRDEYGFLGESTLAIVWMSNGYLDIPDPDHGRSFLNAVDRILASARKREVKTEVAMYEDLLDQVSGFREDYAVLVDECQPPG